VPEEAPAPLEEPGRKKISFFGMNISAREETAKKALMGAGAVLLLVNGIGIPFVLPKLTQRYLGAPYLPMKSHNVNVLFDRVLPSWLESRTASSAASASSNQKLPLAGLRLIDFGSGDGRIVACAAQHGMKAVGFEVNPWLAMWSKLKTRRAISLAPEPGSGKLRWANAWNESFADVDVVTIYGRPGDGVMARAARKFEDELPSSAAVVSHHFDIPGWENYLVQDIEGLKVYDMSRRDSSRLRSRVVE